LSEEEASRQAVAALHFTLAKAI